MRIRPPNGMEVVGKAARPALRRMAGSDTIGVLFVSAVLLSQWYLARSGSSWQLGEW